MNNLRNIVTANAFWLFAIAVLLLLSGMGIREPWPADEPRFALVAKEMVETGQWFFPTRGGEYYPDKPPVFMWAIAGFYALTGALNVAFLLPSALCGLFTLWLVYDLSKRLWGHQEGLIAATVLLCSLQFLLQAKAAQIDAMVTCWITIGCYGLLRFLLIERHWHWYYLAFFFMGIGVITKGVGFLPSLMLIPYYFYQRIHGTCTPSAHRRFVALRWLAGPLVMLAAIALWFLPMMLLVEQSQEPALLQYRDNILFRQTVTRYADAWHHLKPFWYYIVEVIPVFWLPVSLALPWLIPQWYRAFRQGDGRIILPLTWIVLVILFFSISPGKRGVYILPALPMLALISAPYVRLLISNAWFTRCLWFLVLLLSLALLSLGLAGLTGVEFALKLEQKFGISPWSFFLVVGGLTSCLTLLMTRNSPWRVWPLFICLAWGGYSTWGYSLLNHVKTPKNVFQTIEEEVGDRTATIALVNFSEQFILFSPFPIVHFGYHTLADKQIAAAYAWLRDTESARYLLIDETHISGACFARDKVIYVGYAHRTHWVLVGTDAKKTACKLSAENVTTYRYNP